MSAEDPPSFFFNGIDFNNSFYIQDTNQGLTEPEANALYLRKTVQDIATATETFNDGILTNNIQTILNNNALNIGTNTTNTITLGSVNNNLICNGSNIDVGTDNANTFINLNSRDIDIGTSNSGSLTKINSHNIDIGLNNSNTVLNLNSRDIDIGTTTNNTLTKINSPIIDIGTDNASTTINLNSRDIDIGTTTNNTITKINSPIIDIGTDNANTTTDLNSRNININTLASGSTTTLGANFNIIGADSPNTINSFVSRSNNFLYPLSPVYSPLSITSLNIGFNLEASSTTNFVVNTLANLTSLNVPTGVWFIEGQTNPVVSGSTSSSYFAISLSELSAQFDSRRGQYISHPINGGINCQLSSVFILTSLTTIYLSYFAKTISTSNQSYIRATRIA